MLDIVCKVYKTFYLPVVVTSGLDGPHREGSLHYKLRAFDLRKNFLAHEDQENWNMHHHHLLTVLESEFQVNKFPVVIVNEQDHIHFEWVDK